MYNDRTREQIARWYRSKRWQRLRASHLKREPMCMCPEHKGKYIEANVVDHITPHRGNPRLFWNPTNLQSLSTHCHNSWKQSEERADLRGCDADGMPTDPRHPWNE